MNDFTFNVLKIVVSVSCALIVLYLVPYIKNKLKDDKYSDLVVLIHTAVQAAEQTIGAGKGKLKKAEVVAFITNWLNTQKIDITEAQLDNLIEAAVFQMNLEIK